MAFATFVAAGAVSSAVSAITPALPAGIQTDDVLLLPIQTRSAQGASIANAAGGTWTEIGPAQQDGLNPGNRLNLFWSRYNGTQTAPTTNDSGDHQIGAILGFRGCLATGDAYEALAGNADATSDTALTASGSTTLGADRLVLVLAARNVDAAGARYSAWANTDLANIAELFDDGGTAGVGGGIGVISGEKATAGAYGSTTATLAAATSDAFMTLALIPAASGSPPANTVAPAVTGTETQGETLSTTDGTWTNSPTSYAYQWQRDDLGGGVFSNISAATANTYVLTSSDVGCQVRCVVTATNASGSTAANSNAVGLIGPLSGRSIHRTLLGVG